MRLDLNAWEVSEGGVVRADDSPSSSPCSSGDYQVVRPARSSLASDMHEQLGVDLGNRTVVVEHGDDRQDVVKEGEPGRSLRSRGQQHTDSQLRRGDGGDRNFVVVADSIVEVGCRTLRVDQEGCVEEEPGQGLSSISTTDRAAARSLAH